VPIREARVSHWGVREIMTRVHILLAPSVIISAQLFRLALDLSRNSSSLMSDG
jgi:hypothetical protein